MKLFCAPGSSSLLPHIVLLEAGLPFTAILIDEHTKAIEGGGDYRTVNPLGYVPALVLDDGTLLTEGPAIVQYIAGLVPSRQLAPANGTVARTKLQAWLNFFSSEMHKGAFGPLFYEGISEESKHVFRRRLMARFAHLDRHLAGRDYLVGDGFTIADAHSFTVTNWAPRVDFDLSPYANVAASLSTLPQTGEIAVAQAALKALSKEAVRVLVTLAPEHAAELGEVPDHVHLAAYVPHSAVLVKSRLVISHAGHGIVMKALYHGVPMVLVPWGRDQPGVAARAEALGAAAVVRREACNDASVSQAVRRILDDGHFTERAQAISKRLQAEDAVGVACAQLEQLMNSTST